MAEEPAESAEDVDPRARWTTAFGWIAGVCVGLLANYGGYLAWGSESYPVVLTTFGTVVAGGFGGMALGDRLGPAGFRPLGIAAGLSLSVILAFVLTVALSR